MPYVTEFGCDALKSCILVEATQKSLNPGRSFPESRSILVEPLSERRHFVANSKRAITGRYPLPVTLFNLRNAWEFATAAARPPPPPVGSDNEASEAPRAEGQVNTPTGRHARTNGLAVVLGWSSA